MSIKTRLSRDAELRLFRMAHTHRICHPYGARYTHIHEDEFDRFMRMEIGVRVDSDYADYHGNIELAEDRVVVSIDGVPVYDTEHCEPPINEGCSGLGFDRYDDAVSCRWIDHLNRRGMVRQFRDNRYEFCIATDIPLVKILTLLREVGMPSTEAEAREMIHEGRVLLDGEMFTNMDCELSHGFGANISLREWQEGHSVRVYIIYGVGSQNHIPTVEGAK